jgi:hypothetical protein
MNIPAKVQPKVKRKVTNATMMARELLSYVAVRKGFECTGLAYNGFQTAPIPPIVAPSFST